MVKVLSNRCAVEGGRGLSGPILWSPACCLQLLKDAQQRLKIIRWDHLLWAAVSKRSGEIDCLGERRWKSHRLSSPPAIVPLCSLPVIAAGWDDTPIDEWDVGGFVQVEVSLTRVSVSPSRFQNHYESVEASGLWKVRLTEEPQYETETVKVDNERES